MAGTIGRLARNASQFVLGQDSNDDDEDNAMGSSSIIADTVPGDLSFHQYVEWLDTQRWYVEHGFDRRAGMGFMGGGLLGVSTALALVTDKNGRVVGESMPHEGRALANFHDAKTPNKAPHKSSCVWDAPHAQAVAETASGKKPPLDSNGACAALAIAHEKMPEEGIDAWKPRATPINLLRPEKRSLFNHTADNLSAMAHALEAADGERGGGAFYCTDYFGLRERVAGIKRQKAKEAGQEATTDGARITPEELRNTNRVLALEPPIMMLHRMTHRLRQLALVVPCPEDAMLSAPETMAAWNDLYPSRTLVIIPVSGKFSITTSFNLLAALTHAASVNEIKHKPAMKGKPSDRPRPTLVGVASGGYGVLEQMADVSNDLHSVRLVLLQGTGRIADLWAETWPKRGEVDFNPDVAAKQLQNAACFPPKPTHIDCMRQVLTHGELILHPIQNQSSTLQRLCNGILMGDRLLQLAAIQNTAYSRQKKVLNGPRILLINASILLSLASTCAAVLIPFAYPDLTPAALGESTDLARVGYFVSIVLPAVMLIVDQIEAFLGTLRQKEACERAAGLVESQAFRYKTHAGSFSDAALASRVVAGLASDLNTARQLKLAKYLTDVHTEVAKSGAQVALREAKKDVSSGDVQGGAARILKQGAVIVGAKGTKEADELNGDEYIDVRVEPAIASSTLNARYCTLFSLLGRACLLAVSAGSVALAYFGYASFVAITVSASTSLSRWMASTRVEERRKAYVKALSVLKHAKRRWERLKVATPEACGRQSELDRLVLEVEGYLEATLPPASKDDLTGKEPTSDGGGKDATGSRATKRRALPTQQSVGPAPVGKGRAAGASPGPAPPPGPAPASGSGSGVMAGAPEAMISVEASAAEQAKVAAEATAAAEAAALAEAEAEAEVKVVAEASEPVIEHMSATSEPAEEEAGAGALAQEI